jgi:hypothetical protein
MPGAGWLGGGGGSGGSGERSGRRGSELEAGDSLRQSAEPIKKNTNELQAMRWIKPVSKQEIPAQGVWRTQSDGS